MMIVSQGQTTKKTTASGLRFILSGGPDLFQRPPHVKEKGQAARDDVLYG